MTVEEYMSAVAIASEPIIAAVHRGEPAEMRAWLTSIAGLPAPDGVSPVEALVAVLAAQVDPDTNLTDRLDWTRAFDPDVVAACAGAR